MLSGVIVIVPPCSHYSRFWVMQRLCEGRRQDWDGEMIENGAFYLFTAKSYKESGCRLSGRIACFEMAEHNLTEIDSMVDWEVIEVLAGHYGYQPKEQPKASVASMTCTAHAHCLL